MSLGGRRAHVHNETQREAGAGGCRGGRQTASLCGAPDKERFSVWVGGGTDRTSALLLVCREKTT